VIADEGRDPMLGHMPKRIGTGIELLADPTRRQILALIARQVRRPSRIATELGLSRPATSRQLRLLREAGVIEWRAYPGDGRAISYYLNREMAAPVIAWLAGTEVGLRTEDHRADSRTAPVRSDLLRLTTPTAPNSEIRSSSSAPGTAPGTAPVPTSTPGSGPDAGQALDPDQPSS
jgi:DNA-binding transcriptional ArsR family regulator